MLEAGLISYAAFASLTLGMKKHRPSPPLPIMPTSDQSRVAGWVLLGCAVIAAIWRYGPGLGVINWIGQMCIVSALLVLLHSWKPRTALMLAAPALALGLAFIIF